MRIAILSVFLLAQLVAAQLSSSSSSSGVRASSSSSVALIPSSSSSTASSQQQLPCGGAGYNFESLRGTQVSGFYRGFNWTVSICDPIPTTRGCPASTTFGQFNPACTNIMTYNTALPPTWFALPNGVQVYSQTGAGCGGNGLRKATINYFCNPSAITPNLTLVDEPSTCSYVANIDTALVCNAPATGTGPSGVGSVWLDNHCGGHLYDFNNIPELSFNSTVAVGTNYTFYVSMCRSTTARSCSSIQPTSFCQVGPSNQWSLSNMNSSVFATYTKTYDGVSVNIANGLPCGTTPRETLLDIHCGSSFTTPVITSESEYATCKYLFEINMACPAYVAGSSTAPAVVPSSSSSASRSSSTSVVSSSTIVSVSSPMVVTSVSAGNRSSSTVIPSLSTAGVVSSSGIVNPASSAAGAVSSMSSSSGIMSSSAASPIFNLTSSTGNDNSTGQPPADTNDLNSAHGVAVSMCIVFVTVLACVMAL